MTALELADWIENGAPFGKYETAKQAVVMLRQQQAELEVYKEALEKLARLGNGDNYGNSIGNDIAIDALRKAQEK